MIKRVLTTLTIAGLIAVLCTANQAYAAADLINPSFEQAADGNAQKAYGWQDFQGGYQRALLGQNGTYGIRVTKSNTAGFAGAYQRIDLNQSSIKPVLVDGYVRGSSIVNSAGGYFGAGLYAEIVLNDGTVAYWNSPPNLGTFTWRRIGFNTGVLPHVNKPISHIFVIPVVGLARGTAYFDDIHVREFEPNQSAVTLTFDDGEISTYTEARSVLDSHGFDGVTAVVSGLVGDDGYMTQTQIEALESSGWEVVSHTVSHDDLTAMSASAARRQLANSKSQLQNMGFVIKNFAFPFGAYNMALIAEGSKYYRSMRPYETGDTPQGAFTPYETKVRSVISTTSVAEVEGWLAEAKANGRWVNLVFHSIAATGDDVYHTDPAVFAEIIQAVADSGLPVVTFDKGLDMFGAPTITPAVASTPITTTQTPSTSPTQTNPTSNSNSTAQSLVTDAFANVNSILNSRGINITIGN